MKSLITTNINDFTDKELSSADVVIVLKDNSFDIVKNRYGGIAKNLPTELISKVVNNPKGEVCVSWKTK